MNEHTLEKLSTILEEYLDQNSIQEILEKLQEIPVVLHKTFKLKSGQQSKFMALVGDFRSNDELRDDLKQLGRFNGGLSCGPGWLVSPKKLEQLKEILNKHEVEYTELQKRE